MSDNPSSSPLKPVAPPGITFRSSYFFTDPKLDERLMNKNKSLESKEKPPESMASIKEEPAHEESGRLFPSSIPSSPPSVAEREGRATDEKKHSADISPDGNMADASNDSESVAVCSTTEDSDSVTSGNNEEGVARVTDEIDTIVSVIQSTTESTTDPTDNAAVSATESTTAPSAAPVAKYDPAAAARATIDNATTRLKEIKMSEVFELIIRHDYGQSEIARLTARNAELTARVHELESLADVRRDAHEAAVAAEVAGLRDEIAQERERRAEAEARLQKAAAKVAAMKAEKRAGPDATELGALRTELDGLRTARSELQRTVAEREQCVAELERENKQLRRVQKEHRKGLQDGMIVARRMEEFHEARVEALEKVVEAVRGEVEHVRYVQRRAEELEGYLEQVKEWKPKADQK